MKFVATIEIDTEVPEDVNPKHAAEMIRLFLNQRFRWDRYSLKDHIGIFEYKIVVDAVDEELE